MCRTGRKRLLVPRIHSASERDIPMSTEKKRETFLADSNGLIDQGLQGLWEGGVFAALDLTGFQVEKLDASSRAKLESFRRTIRTRILDSYHNGVERGRTERAAVRGQRS